MSSMSNTQSHISKSEIIKNLRTKIAELVKLAKILIILCGLLSIGLVWFYLRAVNVSSELNNIKHDYTSIKSAYDAMCEENEELKGEMEDIKDAQTTEPSIPETEPVTEPPETTQPTEAPTEEKVCSFDTFANVPLDPGVKAYIYTRAIENNIPPEILFAMAKKESNFNPSAVGRNDDHGLFQINRQNFYSLAGEVNLTFDELCAQIYNPYVNTECAIRMLLRYSDPSKYTTTNWHQVLMRYNKGPAGAQELFDQGIYSVSYSEKIIGFAQEMFGLTDITFKVN